MCNDCSWFQHLRIICTHFGFDFSSEKMQRVYEKEWHQNLLNTPKLESYALFKKSFQIENYLSSVDIKSRRMFTKLRTSAHSLNIETGRFSKKTRDLRICNLCNCKQIENEHHFLLKCPYYSKERLSFLKSIDFLILPRDSESKFKTGLRKTR